MSNPEKPFSELHQSTKTGLAEISRAAGIDNKAQFDMAYHAIEQDGHRTVLDVTKHPAGGAFATTYQQKVDEIGRPIMPEAEQSQATLHQGLNDDGETGTSASVNNSAGHYHSVVVGDGPEAATNVFVKRPGYEQPDGSEIVKLKNPKAAELITRLAQKKLKQSVVTIATAKSERKAAA